MNIRTSLGLIFFPLVGLLSCGKTEVTLKPENERTVIYEPFGQGQRVTDFFSINTDEAILCINNEEIRRVNKQAMNTVWSLGMRYEDVVPAGDGSMFCIQRGANYYDITFLRVGMDGKVLFNWPTGDKLVDRFPGYLDHCLSSAPDHHGGIFLLFAEQQDGVELWNIPADRFFIVHINQSNQVDLQLQLNEPFMRISCDQEGNLFGIYLTEPVANYVQNSPDSMGVCLFNTVELMRGNVVKDWHHSFKNTFFAGLLKEYPLFIDVVGDRVFVATPDEKGLFEVEGGLFYTYDTEGHLLQTSRIKNQILVNYYVYGGYFLRSQTSQGVFYSLNFGSASDLIYLNNRGEVALKQSLKGNLTKCTISSVCYDNSVLWVNGAAGQGRIPVLTPFLFKVPINLP